MSSEKKKTVLIKVNMSEKNVTLCRWQQQQQQQNGDNCKDMQSIKRRSFGDIYIQYIHVTYSRGIPTNVMSTFQSIRVSGAQKPNHHSVTSDFHFYGFYFRSLCVCVCVRSLTFDGSDAMSMWLNEKWDGWFLFVCVCAQCNEKPA